MRVKIFYKFFIIIFAAFIVVQYINIKIDYETTLNYKLGLYKQSVEKELSEQLVSFMQHNTLSEEEFYNEFHQRFDHEGYCYHMLVKDEPINFVDIHRNENISIIGNARKAKKILSEYDLDEIVQDYHGVMYIQPYVTYLNHKTGAYETVYVDDGIASNIYWTDNQNYYYQNKYEVYASENTHYTYSKKGSNGIALQNALLVDHNEYRDVCKSYVQKYQVEKNYEDMFFFYENYKEGIIFITKMYIASYDGQQFYRINDESLHLSYNDNFGYTANCLTNEHMRYLTGFSDYYVYSCFYMDSLSLMSEIDDEINQRNMVVYISVLLISFIVSLFLSWMLTRHIKHISKATTQIANNDFSVRLKEYSYDELGTLSANINTMSQKLNDTMTHLNNEIARVTHLEGLRKEFIANFTHEIKTPLGIINGYIELINKSEDESKKAYFLEAIQKESTRINELVMAMLELSRLEAGKIELDKEEVDLEDFVSDILENLFPLLRKKSIKVRMNVVDQIIIADRKEMEKVIRNFMSNAIAHTKENGRIIITYENHLFSVENEGDHLSEEAMRNVFETYVSSNREGTGLGLAICKTILQLHGFNYGVNNTQNGVCFWFEIQ